MAEDREGDTDGAKCMQLARLCLRPMLRVDTAQDDGTDDRDLGHGRDTSFGRVVMDEGDALADRALGHCFWRRAGHEQPDERSEQPQARRDAERCAASASAKTGGGLTRRRSDGLEKRPAYEAAEKDGRNAEHLPIASRDGA